MEENMENSIINLLKNQAWKKKNPKYLLELQRFLDLSDNIKDNFYRKKILNQMIRCDRTLTDAAEEVFLKLLENK